MSSPLPDPLPEDITFSCGCSTVCRVVQGKSVMLFTPCDLDCPTYAIAQTECAKAGRTIEYRHI